MEKTIEELCQELFEEYRYVLGKRFEKGKKKYGEKHGVKCLISGIPFITERGKCCWSMDRHAKSAITTDVKKFVWSRNYLYKITSYYNLNLALNEYISRQIKITCDVKEGVFIKIKNVGGKVKLCEKYSLFLDDKIDEANEVIVCCFAGRLTPIKGNFDLTKEIFTL